MAGSLLSPIFYASGRRSGTAWETVATSIRIAWAGKHGQVLFGVIAWLRTFLRVEIASLDHPLNKFLYLSILIPFALVLLSPCPVRSVVPS